MQRARIMAAGETEFIWIPNWEPGNALDDSEMSRGLILLFCCSQRCLCRSLPFSGSKPLFENWEFVGRDI